MDPSGAAFRSEKAVAKTLLLPVQSPGSGAFEVTLSPQLLSAAPLSQVMATTGQMQPRIWISDLQCNLKVLLNLTICYTHCTSSHLTGCLEVFSPNSQTALCQAGRELEEPQALASPPSGLLHSRLPWRKHFGAGHPHFQKPPQSSTPQEYADDTYHYIKKQLQLHIYILGARTQLHFEIIKSSRKQNIHPNLTPNANAALTEVHGEFWHLFLQQ